MTHRTIPTATATMITTTRNGAVQVSVACPFCAREHQHGWTPGDSGDDGHRVAHCGPNRDDLADAGYCIAVPESLRAAAERAATRTDQPAPAPRRRRTRKPEGIA